MYENEIERLGQFAAPSDADVREFENRTNVQEHIVELVAGAPDAVKIAIIDLISSLKMSLDVVKHYEPRGQGPCINSWEELLVVLSNAVAELHRAQASRGARMRYENHDYIQTEHRFKLLRRSYELQTLMLEIIYDLINTGQDFKTASEVLEESSDILLKELGADLYVCRIRDEGGGWVNIATNTTTHNYTPIFVLSLEESLPDHPVMRAANTTNAIYVLSNDLRGAENGGESFDCTAFGEGYRSRLSFILRDHRQQAFGIVMLYSLVDNFFDRYDSSFLSDCSKIVSLTVGQRLEIGKDALAKASGGMAHVGNNVLSIMKNYTEMLIEDFDEFSRRLQEALEKRLPGDNGEAAPDKKQLLSLLREQRALLDSLKIEKKMNLLYGVLDCVNRMKKAIQNLLDAVDRPIIMPYIRGQEVLDLEPERHNALAMSAQRLPAVKPAN
jgi:hypothetical protein